MRTHWVYIIMSSTHICNVCLFSIIPHMVCIYMANMLHVCTFTHTYIHTLCVCSESATKKTSRDHENLCMSAETDYILQFEISLSLDQHLAK